MPGKILHTLNHKIIRCILFDLGETLWTSIDTSHILSLEQTANQQALTILSTAISPLSLTIQDTLSLGKQLRKGIHSQVIARIRQVPEREPDFALAVNDALQQLNFPQVDHSTGEAIFEALRIPIASSRLLFKDVLTTLSALQARGFLLGVVSNRHYGGQPFLNSIREMGLLNYFDPSQMAISADLGTRKPAPAIFLHALNRLNITPEEAVMVGDSLHADIAGAQNLHIYSVWKPEPSLLTAAKALQPPGNNILNADTLITYATEQENQRYQHIYERVTPDIIIEQLSDLLDIFLKVGSP